MMEGGKETEHNLNSAKLGHGYNRRAHNSDGSFESTHNYPKVVEMGTN